LNSTGHFQCSPIVENRNQLYIKNKLEMFISVNDKCRKYGKRVRFDIDDNIKSTYKIGSIDEFNSKHNDCHLNDLNISEVDTIKNIKNHSKMLFFDRHNDNDVDHIGYPSKNRNFSFNRLNYNEIEKNKFNCNSMKKYPFFKSIKKEDGYLVRFEGQFPRETLKNDHLIHESELNIDDVKYKNKFETIDTIHSIDKNNKNSRNSHNTATLSFGIRSPTNSKCNGSKLYEDNHNAGILNITMVKSNLDRIIKRYRMKQKQIKDDCIG